MQSTGIPFDFKRQELRKLAKEEIEEKLFEWYKVPQDQYYEWFKSGWDHTAEDVINQFLDLQYSAYRESQQAPNYKELLPTYLPSTLIILDFDMRQFSDSQDERELGLARRMELTEDLDYLCRHGCICVPEDEQALSIKAPQLYSPFQLRFFGYSQLKQIGKNLGLCFPFQWLPVTIQRQQNDLIHRLLKLKNDTKGNKYLKPSELIRIPRIEDLPRTPPGSRPETPNLIDMEEETSSKKSKKGKK